MEIRAGGGVSSTVMTALLFVKPRRSGTPKLGITKRESDSASSCFGRFANQNCIMSIVASMQRIEDDVVIVVFLELINRRGE